MGIDVILDQELVNIARAYSGTQCRSVPKQIEHWAKIGYIAEENPNLSYDMIRDILLGLEDVKMENAQDYNPDLFCGRNN